PGPPGRRTAARPYRPGRLHCPGQPHRPSALSPALLGEAAVLAHDPALATRHGVPAVLEADVVPQHHVAGPPLVDVGGGVVVKVAPEPSQPLVALGAVHPDDAVGEVVDV